MATDFIKLAVLSPTAPLPLSRRLQAARAAICAVARALCQRVTRIDTTQPLWITSLGICTAEHWESGLSAARAEFCGRPARGAPDGTDAMCRTVWRFERRWRVGSTGWPN